MINDTNIRFIEQGEHYKNKSYRMFEFSLCTFCVCMFGIFTVGGLFGWIISHYYYDTNGSSSS